MRRKQRGSATIETAFMMTVVMGVGLVCSDLYMLARARADLERTTSQVTATLSNQSGLTEKGVNALLDALSAKRGDRYQYWVAKVLPDRKVSWQLPLGGSNNLCDSPVNGGTFEGELPEADDSQASDGHVALLVVRACQNAQDIGLTQLHLDKTILQADAISRLRTATITLDANLAGLAGIKQ